MAIREYPDLAILRDGGVLEVDGLKVKMVEGKIKANDLYVAQRNGGPVLLTAGEVVTEESAKRDGEKYWGYIIPNEDAYAFDTRECVKVEGVE